MTDVICGNTEGFFYRIDGGHKVTLKFIGYYSQLIHVTVWGSAPYDIPIFIYYQLEVKLNGLLYPLSFPSYLFV